MKSIFKEKNIIITGASQGIGKAISLELARQGANLYLISRNQTKLENLRKELLAFNKKPHIFPADVSSYEDIKKTFDKIGKLTGKIDGLINNAGHSYPEYFKAIPIKEFDKSVRVNYLGSVYCTWLAYPYLSNGAFVSFTSSVAGFMGVFGYSSYAGPKFALFGLAETLAQELAHKKVNVSVLCPPDTETPGFETENKTKPYETKKISEGGSLMKPEKVAQIFVKRLQKGKFLITCNFESALYFRLHGILPGLVRLVMKMLVKVHSRSHYKQTAIKQ